jgi:zinc transporter
MAADKMLSEHSKTTGSGTRTTPLVLPGLVSAFLFHANGAAIELSVDQPLPEHRDGWLWLHFDLADTRSSQSVQAISDLSEPAKAMLITANEEQQLYADDICTYGMFADFSDNLKATADDIHYVAFAMTERIFVSSCRRQFSGMASFCEMIRGGLKIFGSAAFIEKIVTHEINAVDDLAKTLTGNLDDIEEKLLGDEPGDHRQMLGRIRWTTIRLSRQITISLSLIHRLELESGQHAKSPLRDATGRLAQRIDWLNSEVAAVRERAHLLQEEAVLKTGDQTNRHLQVLSIVSTIFLPATLIAGIFGMNVKGLPLTENGNGFLWSIAVLIAASALVYWLLKRSGILDL